MISPKKQQALLERMNELQIYEQDLLEKFIQGSGSGGQKINKTSSCVYLKHLPSGIEVKCQEERSREMNRFFARRALCDQFDFSLHGKRSKKQLAVEKIRKRKRNKKRKQLLKETADID